MRLKVINALKDRSLEPLRRQHPGKMMRRPPIGGRPLAPGASRILDRHHLTKQVVGSLIEHTRVGLVRVYSMSGRGELDLAALEALQQELFPVSESKAPSAERQAVALEEVEVKVEAEKASVKGQEDKLVLELGTDADDTPHEEVDEPAHDIVPVEPKAELEEFLDDADDGEAKEEDAGVESFSLRDDLEERLRKPRVVTNEELRAMLTVLGGVGGGKNKTTLISEILAALSTGDVDPVSANKVMEMLASAEQ